MQHTTAAVAATTTTTPAILCMSKIAREKNCDFSHTHVSHIFTCLQSSRISRLSTLEFRHSRRKRNGLHSFAATVAAILMLLLLFLLLPRLTAVDGKALVLTFSCQLDAMCNKVCAERVLRRVLMCTPSRISIPPSPLRQNSFALLFAKAKEEADEKNRGTSYTYDVCLLSLTTTTTTTFSQPRNILNFSIPMRNRETHSDREISESSGDASCDMKTDDKI